MNYRTTGPAVAAAYSHQTALPNGGQNLNSAFQPQDAFSHSEARLAMNRVHLVTAADIPPENIKWLIPGWLAIDHFQLLAGEAGTGKTSVAIAIMSSFSNGTTGGNGWPGNSAIPMGNVIFWTGEDGVEDTVVPRLMAAGANLSRVHIVRGTIENGRVRPFAASDLPKLSDEIERIGSVGLIVIDPILLVVLGDSNKNSEVRRSLAPLVELAQKHHCAILGITHTNKSSSKKPLIDRINGSLAYGAVARVVMMTGRVERDGSAEGTSSSVIVRAKSNIGPSDGGFEYRLQEFTFDYNGQVFTSSRLAWNPVPLTGSAKAILNNAATGGEGGTSEAVRKAEQFLREILMNGGLLFPDVERLAQDAGISMASIQRAKSVVGVISQKQPGQGRVSPYVWRLPEKSYQQSPPSMFESHQPQVHTNWGNIQNMVQPPPQFQQPNAFPVNGQFPHGANQFPIPLYQPVNLMPDQGTQAVCCAIPAAPQSLAMLAALAMSAEPAEPAAPAAPAGPAAFATPAVSAAHAAPPPPPPVMTGYVDVPEPNRGLDQSLLNRMIDECKQSLLQYLNKPWQRGERDDSDYDEEDALLDRIVAIEWDTVSCYFDELPDEDESVRLSRMYRDALGNSNWSNRLT